MEVISCGVDFPHNKGEFCLRSTGDFYFIGHFSTPFLYERDDQLYPGSPGDILIVPPGDVIWHGPLCKEESFTNDWMHVSGEDLQELLKQYPLPERYAFHLNVPQPLKDCIEKIYDELLFRHPGYQEVIHSCLTETLITIHRLYQYDSSPDSPLFRLKNARETIMRHPEKDWSLQDMALLSSYSASRFCALYKQQYGCSPKSDLLALRLQLAKQLLQYSGLPISEISERCGFKSIYYFSKYFREKELFSPREFRQQYNHPDSTSFL